MSVPVVVAESLALVDALRVKVLCPAGLRFVVLIVNVAVFDVSLDENEIGAGVAVAVAPVGKSVAVKVTVNVPLDALTVPRFTVTT